MVLGVRRNQHDHLSSPLDVRGKNSSLDVVRAACLIRLVARDRRVSDLDPSPFQQGLEGAHKTIILMPVRYKYIVNLTQWLLLTPAVACRPCHIV